jgi:hypothetical protein
MGKGKRKDSQFATIFSTGTKKRKSAKKSEKKRKEKEKKER